MPSINRDFFTVFFFFGDKNVAMLVVAEDRAKVREQGQRKGEASPDLTESLRLNLLNNKALDVGARFLVLLRLPSERCQLVLGR